jgi:hypothetical protein
MTFKNYLKTTDFGTENDEADFKYDFFRKNGGHEHRPFKNWDELENFLLFCRASPEAKCVGEKLMKRWLFNKAAKAREKEIAMGLTEGLNKRDIKHLIRVMRQVWSWSYSRRLVVKRTDIGGGYARCEKCKKKVPKVHVDHIQPVGTFNRSYISRLFVHSKKLQGLCQNCHKVKTKADLKAIKSKKEKIADFY